MRAAVEDGAAVGTDEVREARGLAARVGVRRRRRHEFVAEAAVERRSEASSPTLRIDDPWSQLERRPVSTLLGA